MKNRNTIVVAALLTVIVVLLYQMLNLKQELRNTAIVTSGNQQVMMNGTLGLYNNNSVTSGSSGDGFWLYKVDEQQVYYFTYDKDLKKIVQVVRNINQ
ncbi:hypothetical protein [Paenibacillus albus]|uniref:Uncharacterized protein n=1 Tax=Paenibacillus albus TaxID=2495582 RepID=A0A3S9A5E0_9BACL|nr:hypothetical protein [Paenibacillus albus]AZN40957.1 hypothetical protein EJC50_15735 [Paenibacillus albus]